MKIELLPLKINAWDHKSNVPGVVYCLYLLCFSNAFTFIPVQENQTIAQLQ